MRSVNTYDVPIGATIRFSTASAQQPAAETAASAPVPASGSNESQAPAPDHQRFRASGSQPQQQANAPGAAHGVATGPGPTVHDGAPVPIDVPPDAQGYARKSAPTGQRAPTTTAPIAPDVPRQGQWNLNGHGRTSRNGEAGNEAFTATREWERREDPARYQERNPAYRRGSSPSTDSSASASSSSDSIPFEGGQELPQDDPPHPLRGVRIITEDGNVYYLMADTDAQARIDEYYRQHPDRHRPAHRTAKPTKSALRGTSQDRERDAGASGHNFCREILPTI